MTGRGPIQPDPHPTTAGGPLPAPLPVFRHDGFGAFADRAAAADDSPPAGRDPDPWAGHRTDHAEQLDTYEEQLRTAAWTALRTWLPAATTAVLGSALTADVEPLPPDPGAIARMTESWRELKSTHIIGAIDRILGEVFALLLGQDTTISARPYQEQYLTAVANRWDDVPDTAFRLLTEQLTEGTGAGEGIPELRDRVSSVLSTRVGGSENAWAKEAVKIARTEVIGAFNGGTIAAWRARDAATGQETEKVWLATIDGRTRDSHFRADGQRTALDGHFTVGGAPMDHPGDPTAPIGQWIFCRCTMLEVSPGEDVPDTTDRQLADPGEVQAEIDRRAEQDVVRAYDDPDAPPPATVLAAANPGGTPMGRRTWTGLLAPFGKPTGDGRIFKVGGLTARDLPLPLLYQSKTAMGHDGSVVVGRILTAGFTTTAIDGSGDFFDPDEVTGEQRDAVLAAIHDVDNELGGVSVDLDSVVGSLVDDKGDPVDMDELFEAWDAGENPIVLEQVDEGRLIAATMVATPAFAEAKIVLDPIEVSQAAALVASITDSAGEALEVGAVVEVPNPDPDGPDPDQQVIRGTVTEVDDDADTVTVEPEDGVGETFTVPAATCTVVTPAPAADEAPDGGDQAAAAGVLVAAATRLPGPPAAAFEQRPLDGPTPITIVEQDDGPDWVFGHVGTWGTCHIGYPGTCVEPPSSPTNYTHFHRGAVRLDDGTRVPVGNLTLGGKHADVRAAYGSAIEHYDLSTAGVAQVRAYEDEHGIAIFGVLNPGITAQQLYDLERCPLSGDWREIGGQLDMVGALAVNSPGFGIPRPEWSTGADGQRTALVAAPGVAPRLRPDGARRDVRGPGRQGLSAEEFRRQVVREVQAAQRRQDRLARLASSIGRDPQSRLAQLAADVHPA